MSKILIIEDEEAIADLEKDYLELSGFEVEIQNNGDVGLQEALSKDFDLIILDLMLPGMDGFEVCKRIRDEKNVPILMVSAKKDDIDKIRGLGMGADDYMTKPFSPSELVARVKAHLARYERLIGSGVQENAPRAMILWKSVVCGLIKLPGEFMWMEKKRTSPTRNLIYLPSWRRIPTTFSPKKNCSEKSGEWNPSVILQL